MSDTIHSLNLDATEDDWHYSTCACGWRSGPMPSAEDAADAYGDHLGSPPYQFAACGDAKSRTPAVDALMIATAALYRLAHAPLLAGLSNPSCAPEWVEIDYRIDNNGVVSVTGGVTRMTFMDDEFSLYQRRAAEALCA